MQHTSDLYSSSPHLVVGLRYSGGEIGILCPHRAGIMQDAGYGLPGMSLQLGNRVNRVRSVSSLAFLLEKLL
jgi:hypothetical protein